MYNSIITENLWTGSHRKDQGEPSPPSRSNVANIFLRTFRHCQLRKSSPSRSRRWTHPFWCFGVSRYTSRSSSWDPRCGADSDL